MTGPPRRGGSATVLFKVLVVTPDGLPVACRCSGVAAQQIRRYFLDRGCRVRVTAEVP